MTRTRIAAAAVLSLRVAYGAALVAAPARLTGRWLGSAAQTGPTQVPLRALGARELVLHLGALRAALGGAPLRSWLAASVAGDITDITATIAARAQLPSGSPAATLLVGGGSALLSAALAVAIDS